MVWWYINFVLFGCAALNLAGDCMDYMETCWRLAGDLLETCWRLAGNPAGNPVKFAGNKIQKLRDSGRRPPCPLPELRFLLESLLESSWRSSASMKLIGNTISSKRS
jgi:hypothetical protein